MRLLLALLLLAPSVAMGQVSFVVCGKSTTASFTTWDKDGYKTENVYVLCPPDATSKTTYRANITFRGCIGPTVQRIGAEYTLKCKEWKKFDLVPAQ